MLILYIYILFFTSRKIKASAVETERLRLRKLDKWTDVQEVMKNLPAHAIATAGLKFYWEMLDVLSGLVSFRGPPPLSVDQSLKGIILV